MRDHILNEIKRLAVESGQAPGETKFERETGIASHNWRGKFWARWGDALSEAGYEPNEWNQRLETEQVILGIIAACRHYHKFPTKSEFELYRQNNKIIPSYGAITRHFTNRFGLIDALRKFIEENFDYIDIAPFLPKTSQVTPVKVENPASKTDGFVYLLKSGDFYKLGRSDDIERRVKQIRVALPDKATLIHTIRTDDPPGIESYWHNRFNEKRANGEWFKLSSLDISAFKKRKYQ